jgi:hypothetical protein
VALCDPNSRDPFWARCFFLFRSGRIEPELREYIENYSGAWKGDAEKLFEDLGNFYDNQFGNPTSAELESILSDNWRFSNRCRGERSIQANYVLHPSSSQ